MRSQWRGACFILIVASAASHAQSVTNYQTAGNLATHKPMICAPMSAVTPHTIPPDIYAGLRDCVDKKRYDDAAALFAIGGVYSYFDALRVSDPTARQAHTALSRQTLGPLDDDAKKATSDAVNALLGDDTKRAGVCVEIRRIGVPTYHPDYMIQHGMQAVQGTSSGDKGLTPAFDDGAGWEQALRDYLRCPAA